MIGFVRGFVQEVLSLAGGLVPFVALNYVTSGAVPRISTYQGWNLRR